MTTTEQTNFLRNICEHPADIHARLVYADWLEERGDVRADFIRTQCQIVGKFDRFGASIGTLLERERELLEEFGLDWVRPVHGKHVLGEQHRIQDATVEFQYGDGDVTHAYTFHRGFPEIIRCTLTDWIGERCPLGCFHGYDSEDDPCERCSGTGRIGGHGPAIVQATPVLRVEFIPEPFWNDLSTEIVRELPSGPWAYERSAANVSLAAINNARRIVRQQHGGDRRCERCTGSGLSYTDSCWKCPICSGTGRVGGEGWADLTMEDVR